MTKNEELQRLIGDDYRLQWVVGNGGMSTVWLADDLRNHREVAIKVLRPEFSDNEEFLSRFRNEALASEKIDSENVVRTYDFRETTDPSGRTLCFIIMEYVRGESLADMLARKGHLEEHIALDVLEQAAHGLSIIHRMGLVHRDIKPGNLLITQNGQVKITDFGIAKAAAAVPLTRTGMVVGTAQYVSPEQAQGKDVGPTSDIYSLGVVGYEMLAGHRPFSGDSSVSVAIAHINQAPPALPTSVSAQTREFIGICLRKDSQHRYANGNEMALAVRAVRQGNRPPQPRSMPTQRIAPQPTPTASTQMLGQTAQPTTVMPATGGQPAPIQYPTTGYQHARNVAPATKEKQGSGVLGGLLAALLVAGLIGGGIWAYSSGLFGNDDGEEVPMTVTETVSESPEETEEPVTMTTIPPSTTSTHPTTTTQQTRETVTQETEVYEEPEDLPTVELPEETSVIIDEDPVEPQTETNNSSGGRTTTTTTSNNNFFWGGI